MDRRWVLVAILFALGALTLNQKFFTHSAVSEWKYRTPIYINSTQSYDDANVLLTVDTLSLISQGKMRPDCGDIRFYYVNPESGNETKIPYFLKEGCDTNHTTIYIKIPHISSNATTLVYMYYGNPAAESESNSSAFTNNATVVIGKYFEEHTLRNMHHTPNRDIYGRYWSDAGRDAFDNYGYTRINDLVYLTIKPYEVGGESYRLQSVHVSNVGNFIIYKDMLPGYKGNNLYKYSVLRTVILPSDEETATKSYSIHRWGNLGSDGNTHYATYTFTCNGRTYKYIMSYDWGSNPNQGDPNIAYFMFCAGASNQDSYTYSYSGDNLHERYNNAKGVCVLYIAPTDNPLGDSNLADFFCDEIKYFERFAGSYFTLDANKNLVAHGLIPYVNVSVTYGPEERISLEPDTYSMVSVELADTYERGEVATVYVKVENVTTIKQVTLEVLDASGNVVHGPVNMTSIDSSLYSYAFNTSVLEPGTYLVRVEVMTSDNKIYGGVAPIKIQVHFAELKTYIGEQTQTILDFLRNEILPKLNSIELKVDNVSHNLSVSYSELVEIRDDLSSINTKVDSIQFSVQQSNETLYNEIQSVKAKTDTLLNKVDYLIQLIENTVLVKLDNMNETLLLVRDDISYIKGEINDSIKPEIASIESRLDAIQNQLNEINSSIAEHDSRVLDKIDTLNNNLLIIDNKIEYVKALLRCDESPENSVCYKLDNIERMISDLQNEATETKNLLQDLDSYVRYTLTPKIDDLLTDAQTILHYQNATYNQVVTNYNKINEVLREVQNLEQISEEVRTELQDHEAKLEQINSTLYEVLLDIRSKVIPKIDAALNGLSEVEYNLTILKNKLDCSVHSGLCEKIDNISTELRDVRTRVEYIEDKVANLEVVEEDTKDLLKKVDDISSELDDLGYDVLYMKRTLDREVVPNLAEVHKVLYSTTSTSSPTNRVAGAQTVIPLGRNEILLVAGGIITIIFAVYLFKRYRETF